MVGVSCKILWPFKVYNRLPKGQVGSSRFLTISWKLPGLSSVTKRPGSDDLLSSIRKGYGLSTYHRQQSLDLDLLTISGFVPYIGVQGRTNIRSLLYSTLCRLFCRTLLLVVLSLRRLGVRTVVLSGTLNLRYGSFTFIYFIKQLVSNKRVVSSSPVFHLQFDYIPL